MWSTLHVLHQQILRLGEDPGFLCLDHLSSSPDGDKKPIPSTGKGNGFTLKTIFIIYLIYGEGLVSRLEIC
jgi:hypothetical protein